MPSNDIKGYNLIEKEEETFVVHLEGFEGPLDLLLQLARVQKVDLAKISILNLVEQYLNIIESARRIKLELAAEWLVMAAWLAWLKSNLLLPKQSEALEEAEQLVEVLHGRIEELERINHVAQWMQKRPRLGQEIFVRGQFEELTEIDSSELSLDLSALIRAYLRARRRHTHKREWRVKGHSFWTVKEALGRLKKLLGRHNSSGWQLLDSFLPNLLSLKNKSLQTDQKRHLKAAWSGTLLASLELAKTGQIILDQQKQFGQIFLQSQKLARTEQEKIRDSDRTTN